MEEIFIRKMIVKNKVKEFIKDKEMMTASDYLDDLQEEVEKLVSRHCDRAKLNGRRVVSPRDI